MYNFFINSQYFPKGMNFQSFFEHKFGGSLTSLIESFLSRGTSFIQKTQAIQKDITILQDATLHTNFLDATVSFQFTGIYLALIRAENLVLIRNLQQKISAIDETLIKQASQPKEKVGLFTIRPEAYMIGKRQHENNREGYTKKIQEKTLQNQDITKRCADILLQIQQVIDSTPPDQTPGAIGIMEFIVQLLSTDILENKIYKNQLVSSAEANCFLDFIRGICCPNPTSQVTLYDPQLYLRAQFSQAHDKLLNQELTLRKFPNQLTAYYLNLMLIATTINDGRTHFLGLDRISWNSYLSSICLENADFFSLENTTGRTSPPPPNFIFIRKEQAISFLRDQLHYPPLQPTRGLSMSAQRPPSPVAASAASARIQTPPPQQRPQSPFSPIAATSYQPPSPTSLAQAQAQAQAETQATPPAAVRAPGSPSSFDLSSHGSHPSTLPPSAMPSAQCSASFSAPLSPPSPEQASSRSLPFNKESEI